MMVEQVSTHPEELATPRIFALVIGIDRYKNPRLDYLTGCRNDGKRFISYLTDVLGVSPSRIKFLADEEATREEILKHFDQFLVKNTDIQRDDAIVFFFAGHGSQLDAPPGWETENNKIESLCPHDVQTIGDDGKEIWSIPDRTINALLRNLAFKKGDNIVVVLDCCHSGGLTRAEGIRSIPPPPYPPPTDLDQEIWASILDSEFGSRTAHTVIQAGFQYKAMASHVLLAACRSDEQAMEVPSAKDAPGGLFTTALVECLRRCSPYNTSYAKLFEIMDLKQKNQHPQCEGTNKDRLLFSVNTIPSDETTFKVSEKGNRVYVSAGDIHGVVMGTEFTVRSFTRKSVLKAKKVGSFTTMLEGSNHKITDGRAIVSRWNRPTLRVHSSIQRSGIQVTVVPTHEPADIALRQTGEGNWEVERLDLLIPTYSGRFFQFKASVKQMEEVLDAIASFNSYLYRSEGTAVSFSGRVKARLNPVGVVQGEFNPVGDDILAFSRSSHLGANLKEAMITDFNRKYSFTLENFSAVDLFPYLFYFDPSDYSIQIWYEPPSPTTPAPLKRIKADGSPSLFALGYGGFGTDPIEFYLPPGHEIDSGFLKVFLTTTYVNMNNISQSPISDGEVLSSSGKAMNFYAMNNLKGAWTSETFVLTCKRS